MKYTTEERLDIGRKIYNREITKYEAVEQYGISISSARDYMRLYRKTYNLPIKRCSKGIGNTSFMEQSSAPKYEEYERMSKEELIRELVKARVDEARAKKGYKVKGDGAEKVFIPLDSENTK